jgi:serine/threonine-protein kinase SRPK3
LEDRISALEGESKQELLDFARKMLRWLPEERVPASKLLQDPWMAEVIQ